MAVVLFIIAVVADFVVAPIISTAQIVNTTKDNPSNPTINDGLLLSYKDLPDVPPEKCRLCPCSVARGAPGPFCPR